MNLYNEFSCPKCGGTGKYTYGSTAIFFYGIGGQALRTNLCDKCWGSGLKDEPWTNVRELVLENKRLKDELKRNQIR